MKALVSASLSSLLLAASAHAQSAPEKLDLDAAVQRALAQTPGLAAVRARQEAAEAQASSLRGRLLPSVNLSEEYQHYTEPFSIQFGPQKFQARDQDTNVFAAAANQPLLGLLHLTQEKAALDNSADAAAEQAKSVEATVREQVETGFLRYFEAQAMVDIAKSSEGQLAEQRSLAQARLNAGVITNADVLRIETAQATAKLQEVQAQSQVDSVRSSLLVALGYEPGASVDFVEPTQLLESVPAAADDVAVQRQAEERRPEVKAAQLANQAASHQERGRMFALLPEVNLVAAYVKINGQPLASPEDKYVGVKATWPMFTWGADWYAYKASTAQAQAAAKQAEDQARTVRIEAARRSSELRASLTEVEVAQTAIAAASEAYRVTNAQVKAGVATSTTDLLDAQSKLTQAQLQLARAKYERAIANIALRRAVGG